MRSKRAAGLVIMLTVVLCLFDFISSERRVLIFHVNEDLRMRHSRCCMEIRALRRSEHQMSTFFLYLQPRDYFNTSPTSSRLLMYLSSLHNPVGVGLVSIRS
jgi:hypothetical protein